MSALCSATVDSGSKLLSAIRLESLRPVKKYAKNLNEILWPTAALEIHIRNSAMYPVHSRLCDRKRLELPVWQAGIRELYR